MAHYLWDKDKTLLRKDNPVTLLVMSFDRPVVFSKLGKAGNILFQPMIPSGITR